VYLHREYDDEDHYEFVRIKVPDVLPRLVHLGSVLRKFAGKDDERDTFIWLEDVIADNLDLLFPGMRVVEHHPFRVIRNADIDYEHEREDEMLDISAIIERARGTAVRSVVPERSGEISQGCLTA
jgi:polyphosphate kinase